MAGTRTAPAFTATATQRLITFHFVDSSGDSTAQSVPVALAATAADIEALAAKYQAASQASLWQITDNLLRSGDKDPDNATSLQRSSVASGINLLFKHPTTLDTNSLRVFAPVTAAMQGNQDIPLLSDASLSELITAALALQTGYNFRQAQYTERKERKNNPVVS